MLPKVAIIDPELMIGMPPAITAATGMDAFTQLLEPYVSNKANQITDMYCREGISKIAGFLKNAYQNGADLTSREQMALAAMYSGIALANSGLGAIHGLAGPLGGLIGASHGALCARLAAPVIEMNVRALDDRDPNHQAVSRYNEISKLVDPNGQGERQGLAGWTYSLVEDLKIPRLRDMGLEKSQFPEVIAQAKIASSMKANPIILEEGDLGWILSEAF
jgi:alcohol dehydrogenase class IV